MMNTFILSTSCLLALSSAITLPEYRRACKKQEITIIPDEYDYYEESFELSFDTSYTVNNIPITQIVEEECGLRDTESLIWSGRHKRSVIGRGVRHLTKLLYKLYRHGKRIFRGDLLLKISHALAKVRPFARKTSTVLFYDLVWKHIDDIRKETRDVEFEAVLENTMRASFEMLIQNGKLSELMLNEPSTLERIQRRMPIENLKLLEMVEATNVMCHQSHRDSQVVIFMKLKIPKTVNVSAETCDDIGAVFNRTYQYYNLPPTTFSHQGKEFKVDIGECFQDHFMFCPAKNIRPTECHKGNLEKCDLIREKLPPNFSRELAVGFAIYGKVTQIITKRGEMSDDWRVRPHLLYHLIPRNGEVVQFGSQPLKQVTNSKDTVIVEVKE